MQTEKLYYSKYFCPETLQILIAAEFSTIKLQLNEINKKYDTVNLVTKQGTLNRTNAILRYLANGTPLNGTTSQQRNRINTWYQRFNTQLLPLLTELYGQVFGQKPANQTKYTYCINEITKELKVLEESLKFKTFFIGHNISIFDITLACYLQTLFKLIVTEGERKKLINLFRWFSYVRSIPVFTKYQGKMVLCGKDAFKVEFNPEQKTQQKTETKAEKSNQQKKITEVKQQAKQVDQNQKEKKQEPNQFKLDDFKRQFQNSNNQLEVLNNLLNTISKEKFSIWKIHYDKDPSEGKVLFLTQNLANGSLQRIENIRKVAFGSWGVYGQEGGYEIRGVMMWQGTEIHPIWKQHPAFEYHKFTRLFPQNEEDRKLILDYIMMEAESVEGLARQQVKRIV